MKCVQIIAVEPFVPESERLGPLLQDVCESTDVWFTFNAEFRFNPTNGSLEFDSTQHPVYRTLPIVPVGNNMSEYDVLFEGYGWQNASGTPTVSIVVGPANSGEDCLVVRGGEAKIRHNPTGQQITVPLGDAYFGLGCGCHGGSP